MKLRKVIDDKCKDCSYDKHCNGTWRQQVEACQVTSCPLYPVRPKAYKRKEKEKEPQYVTEYTHPHVVLSLATPISHQNAGL